MKIWSLILHIGMWCIASLFWHDRFQHLNTPRECFQLVQNPRFKYHFGGVGNVGAANVAIVFESNWETASLTPQCVPCFGFRAPCTLHTFTAINKRFNTEVTCIPTKFITTARSIPQSVLKGTFFACCCCFFLPLLRFFLLFVIGCSA